MKNQTAIMAMLWLNVHLEALQADWKILSVVSVVFITLCIAIILIQAIQAVEQYEKTK